jgi:hypothetical protein
MLASEVFTKGASAVIETVSVTPPTSITGSTRALRFTSRKIPTWLNFLKPGALTSTRYVPKGRALKTYLPDSSATRVRVKLVSCCVTVISTPGTTAPVESVTVPNIEDE